VLIETAAIADDSLSAHFNAGGRFLPGSNFFLVGVELLDYWLRLLKLAPLDCAFYINKRTPRHYRIAIMCRAVGEQPISKDDTWAPYMARPTNFLTRQYIDWNELKTGAPDVEYTPSDANLIYREDTGTVNLYQTMQANPSMPVDDVNEQIRLKLDAIY
jgi:hypothetical protein